ncbi:MAG: hypothetical protein FJ288_11770 [Planctomycetes bacterium]|nr:hypothetical protein [Planctomycetota bacterium]
MLAVSQTRLMFWSDGLTMTAWAVIIAGTAVFWTILAHWVYRTRSWRLAPLLLVPPLLALAGWLRRREPPPAAATGAGGGAAADEGEPVLPWWQILVGFALAGMLVPMTLAAGRSGEAPAQLALMILMALACAVWVLFFYLRVYTYLGRLPMALMLALRLTAIVLLVLLVFKPLLSFEERLERRTDLYVLVDASKSMSVSDYPDTPNRMGLATKQVEDYLDRLQAAFEVKLFAFDTRAHEAQPGQWPDPKGDATNITRALKDVLAAARKSDTTGILLMTDGIHNAGGSVVDDVVALAPPHIYAVGVGTDLTAQSGYQDISIEAVRAPEECTVNNLTKITVDVEAVGLADRSVEVELREGETPLAAEPLRLDGMPGTQGVTLAVTPTVTGRHTYTVRIRPDPAERRTENNERQVHLLATDPKIRVFYIEGVVRPEYKPLKSILETDPNAELLALVQVKRGEFLQSGSMTGITLSGFPQTLEDMRKFDVFIIGDMDRSYFSGQQMENLKTVVSDGRGLVMIGGYNSLGPGGYEGTAVEEILPVQVGPRTIGQETTPFVLKLTPEGANHPIFHGTKDFFRYQSDAPVERLPYLKGCNIVARAKAGASVLAIHPERAGPSGPLTVLAVHQYGKGRAAAFAADTTYQWYLPYKALGRDSPYIRFWSQMVRWLAAKEIKEQSSEPGVSLLVLKPFYNPGEKVTVRAKVRAEEGRATNFAAVTGVLLGPGDERKDVPLALEPGAVGVYAADLGAPDPGQYRLLVEARKDNKRLGLAEIEFSVGRPNQEFDRLSVDRALLKKLAQATAGEYYEPANFGDLVERLRHSTIKEDIHREWGIQTIPGLFTILFGLFLAIVTAEWLLRKYYQLN